MLVKTVVHTFPLLFVWVRFYEIRASFSLGIKTASADSFDRVEKTVEMNWLIA